MSIWKEIKEIPSSKKQLREFGWVMGIFFAGLYGFLFWKGRSAGYFLGIPVFFLLSAWLLPAALRPLQKIWMTLALILGAVMSRIILAFLFYLVFTPIGFLLKITGKDLLQLDGERKENSYWRDHATKSKESYEKQY